MQIIRDLAHVAMAVSLINILQLVVVAWFSSYVEVAEELGRIPPANSPSLSLRLANMPKVLRTFLKLNPDVDTS